jgi:hypothetical protein
VRVLPLQVRRVCVQLRIGADRDFANDGVSQTHDNSTRSAPISCLYIRRWHLIK